MSEITSGLEDQQEKCSKKMKSHAVIALMSTNSGLKNKALHLTTLMKNTNPEYVSFKTDGMSIHFGGGDPVTNSNP